MEATSPQSAAPVLPPTSPPPTKKSVRAKPSIPAGAESVAPAARKPVRAGQTKNAQAAADGPKAPTQAKARKNAKAAKQTGDAAKPAPAAPLVKEAKNKKPKLVRDSFTFPKDEYAVIEVLKQRAAGLGHPIKKSELLRAGLKALASLSDNALRTALKAVPSIKTGRPKAEDNPESTTQAQAAPAKASARSTGRRPAAKRT